MKQPLLPVEEILGATMRSARKEENGDVYQNEDIK
jgi:hypothetical protein